MSELKDRIESLFWATLEKEPEVHPWGLCAEFAKEANLAHNVSIRMVEGTMRRRFRSEDLYNLTEEFGVVSLTNAFLQNDNPNLDLTGSNPKSSVSIQDPFHVDPIAGVTLLQKNKNVIREVPTYYSFADDVRKAIAILDRKNLSQDVGAAIDIMQYDDYQFSYEQAELIIRDTIQFAFPDFSKMVFAIISEDRKFEKIWTSDKSEVVLHSNRHNFIVHGRPASNCTLPNNLRGIEIEP